jgi:hypothetical protein
MPRFDLILAKVEGVKCEFGVDGLQSAIKNSSSHNSKK